MIFHSGVGLNLFYPLLQPRTEAFSAVPVGAQAYFNSQAGLRTLAVIPGETPSAGGVRGGKSGAGANIVTTRVLRKRGWRTRNRYTSMAKGDRLRDEREARRQARESGENVDTDDDGEETDRGAEDEDYQEGGLMAGAESRELYLERLLRTAQVSVKERSAIIRSTFPGVLFAWIAR